MQLWIIRRRYSCARKSTLAASKPLWWNKFNKLPAMKLLCMSCAPMVSIRHRNTCWCSVATKALRPPLRRDYAYRYSAAAMSRRIFVCKSLPLALSTSSLVSPCIHQEPHRINNSTRAYPLQLVLNYVSSGCLATRLAGATYDTTQRPEHFLLKSSQLVDLSAK